MLAAAQTAVMVVAEVSAVLLAEVILLLAVLRLLSTIVGGL